MINSYSSRTNDNNDNWYLYIVTNQNHYDNNSNKKHNKRKSK